MTTEKELGYDPINHPQHYTQGRHEVVEVFERWGMDRDAYVSNAVKYIARCYWKGTFENDLKKAIWYLNRRISIEPTGFWNWVSPKYIRFDIDPIDLDEVICDWKLYKDLNLALAIKAIAENDFIWAVHYIQARIEETNLPTSRPA